jgi:hypothetical protein
MYKLTSLRVNNLTIAKQIDPSCLTSLAARTIGWMTSLSIVMGWSCPTLAQSSFTTATPEICDVNLTEVKANDVSSDPNIVTADTVSAEGTTVPSLWWTNEQFPTKLVKNWIANRNQKQIYLLVSTQYWNVLDYIDRYRTIDRFGRVAQSYGYNLKICNSQKIALARYTCDSILTAKGNLKANSTSERSLDPKNTQHNCQIWLDVNGQDGMGVRMN